MIHSIINLIFPILIISSVSSNYSCSDYFEYHPVKNEIGLQVLLQKNGYYTGKIDGEIGSKSILAIKNFQDKAGLSADGVVGKNTCTEFLSIKYHDTEKNKQNQVYIVDETLKEAQQKLKDLGLYTGDIDGIKGTKTSNAIKLFQSKAGLIVDGILGPNTENALNKGADSYVDSSPQTSSSSINTQSYVSSSALDLSNYDVNKPCTSGYVNELGVWVPDPCFYPVFVYRFGKVAQVNSVEERDAYLADRWSLTPEKVYTAIGSVNTENYIDGINSPINGLIMPGGKSYPNVVLGIKNDNNLRARPQSGPQDADAVFEVLVEGGMTRFINLFYQSDTSYHGPIRSARPTDPTVLRPVNGVLIASGATSGLIPEIIDIGVPVISDQRTGYYRISTHPSGSNRKAPHNLYADTNLLRQRAINLGYRPSTHPQALFPWGEPDISKWVNVSKISLTFSNYTTATWTWNGSSYVRTYYDAYTVSYTHLRAHET